MSNQVFKVVLPLVYVCAMLLPLSVSAENKPHPERHREQPFMLRALNFGNWVGRQVVTPEFMEQTGISAEQSAKLKEIMLQREQEQKKLQEEINALALQQAQLARGLLSRPNIEVDELMDLIDKIGGLRTEQAKVNTRILIDIHEVLNSEQRQKASLIIAQEGRKRRLERQQRRDPVR